MKHLTGFLLFAFFLTGVPNVLHAQQVRSITTWGPEDEEGHSKKVMERFYDRQGNLIRTVEEYCHHSWSYDKKGRPLIISYDCGEDHTFQQYTYSDTAILMDDIYANPYYDYLYLDADGRIIKRKSGNHDDAGKSSGNLNITNYYTYNEQGLCSSITSNWDNDGRYMQDEQHYYDASDRPTKSLYRDNGEGKYDSVAYHYDPSGRLQIIHLTVGVERWGPATDYRHSSFEMTYKHNPTKPSGKHHKQNLEFINEVFGFNALDYFFPRKGPFHPDDSVHVKPTFLTDEVMQIEYIDEPGDSSYYDDPAHVIVNFSYDKMGRLTQISANNATESPHTLMAILYKDNQLWQVKRFGFDYGDWILTMWEKKYYTSYPSNIDVYKNGQVIRHKKMDENGKVVYYEDYAYQYH